MKILLVVDDAEVIDFLVCDLENEGHSLTVARDGAEGLHFASSLTFDIVVLDLVLPILNGRDVCQTLRANKVDVKILMLGTLETTVDILSSLRVGADDFITRPFSCAELLARLEVLHSRTTRLEHRTKRMLNVGDIDLYRDSLQVIQNGKLVELATLEFNLLEFLMLNRDEIVSRDAISAQVWGVTDGQKTNVVDVYIRKLRLKLFKDDAESHISTIRGQGYRLNSHKQ